ncbi:MAG: hypothetical protein ACREN7_04450 [Candidatus Dormibacteria bacterium]
MGGRDEAEEVSETPLPPPEELARLSESALARLVEQAALAERQLRQQMAPFQSRLAELGQRTAALQTEVRRRERQEHIRTRQAVRLQVKEGEAPSLAQLLAAPEPPELGEPAFSELQFLLESGGQVALGYPGSRQPTLQMTDGGQVRSVVDLAEARRLYKEGWDVGVPARRGVRVHTPGTRLERLLDPEKCFVRRPAPEAPPAAPDPG